MSGLADKILALRMLLNHSGAHSDEDIYHAQVMLDDIEAALRPPARGAGDMQGLVEELLGPAKLGAFRRRVLEERAATAIQSLTAQVQDDYPEYVGAPVCKIASYNYCHEQALGLGYPAIDEALDALEDVTAQLAVAGQQVSTFAETVTDLMAQLAEAKAETARYIKMGDHLQASLPDIAGTAQDLETQLDTEKAKVAELLAQAYRLCGELVNLQNHARRVQETFKERLGTRKNPTWFAVNALQDFVGFVGMWKECRQARAMLERMK